MSRPITASCVPAKDRKFQALPLQYDVRFPTLVAKQTPTTCPPDSPLDGTGLFGFSGQERMPPPV